MTFKKENNFIETLPPYVVAIQDEGSSVAVTPNTCIDIDNDTVVAWELTDTSGYDLKFLLDLKVRVRSGAVRLLFKIENTDSSPHNVTITPNILSKSIFKQDFIDISYGNEPIVISCPVGILYKYIDFYMDDVMRFLRLDLNIISDDLTYITTGLAEIEVYQTEVDLVYDDFTGGALFSIEDGVDGDLSTPAFIDTSLLLDNDRSTVAWEGTNDSDDFRFTVDMSQISTINEISLITERSNLNDDNPAIVDILYSMDGIIYESVQNLETHASRGSSNIITTTFDDITTRFIKVISGALAFSSPGFFKLKQLIIYASKTPIDFALEAVEKFSLFYTGESSVNIETIEKATATQDPSGMVKQGKVFDVGGVGEFDEDGVYDACVIPYETDLRMFYTGELGGVSKIGVANSQDGGDTWTRENGGVPVLGLGTGFDSEEVFGPSVIKEGGNLFMLYTGVGSDGKPRIGQAESGSGIMWVRRSLPIIDIGGVGEFDEDGVKDPVLQIVYDSGGTKHYRVFYTGIDASDNETIGLAHSIDGGISWTKYGSNPILGLGGVGEFDESSAREPTVSYQDMDIEYNTTTFEQFTLFRMYYAGTDSSGSDTLGLATSLDGINWLKHGQILGEGGVGEPDEENLTGANLLAYFEPLQEHLTNDMGNVNNNTSSTAVRAYLINRGVVDAYNIEAEIVNTGTLTEGNNSLNEESDEFAEVTNDENGAPNYSEFTSSGTIVLARGPIPPNGVAPFWVRINTTKTAGGNPGPGAFQFGKQLFNIKFRATFNI